MCLNNQRARRLPACQGKLKGGLQEVADQLGVKRIGAAHQVISGAGKMRKRLNYVSNFFENSETTGWLGRAADGEGVLLCEEQVLRGRLAQGERAGGSRLQLE